MNDFFLSDWVLLPNGEIGQIVDTDRAEQNLFIVEDSDGFLAEYSSASLKLIDDPFEVTE